MIPMPDSVHLCDCRDLNVGTVRDAIRDNGLKTVQDIIDSTEAGCCCESCISPDYEEGRTVYLVDLLKEVNG